MYDESLYFDHTQDPINPIPESFVDCSSQASTYNNNNNNYYNNELEGNIRVSTFTLEELSNPNHASSEEVATSMGLDRLQHQLGFDLEHDLHRHLIQHDTTTPMEGASSWDPTIQEATIHHQQQHFEEQQNLGCYDTTGGYPNPPYPAVPDLLNLLQLPRQTSISFGGSSLNPAGYPLDMFGEADGGSMLYNSSMLLGFPPQQNMVRDMYNSLPQNYGLFYGVEEREAAMAGVGGGMVGGEFLQEMQDGRHFDSTLLDYRREVGGDGKGEVTVSFVTEKHRREQLNEKYKTLRSLIPNPTKVDRASVVGDAIEYIKELRRTVEELKTLLEQKRRRGRRILKAEDEAVAADMESSSMRPLREDLDHHLNEALRSSWIQRRSKDSFVDVYIIDDEVNIKLTQKRKVSCLLSVAKSLDELQLDLVHITGGNIGDHYIFMFNAKICEGSSVYAGAIAKKLLEVMDRQYQTLKIHNSF